MQGLVINQKGRARVWPNAATAAQAVSANVTTWFPESGEHMQTPAGYPEEFEQRLVGFFREALGE